MKPLLPREMMPPARLLPGAEGHDRTSRGRSALRARSARARLALLPQRAQDAPHEHVEPLQAEALGDQVAQERLRDLQRRPSSVGRRRRQDPALEHPPDDAARGILVCVEDPGPDQRLDAAGGELEDVDVLVDRSRRRSPTA